MFKYNMLIDNERYSALFEDHFEACDFIEIDNKGSEVIILNYKEVVSVDDILKDDDLEHDYKVEMAIIFLGIEHKHMRKMWEYEKALKDYLNRI